MHHLRFRQIHLDFHTSIAIPGIGEKFDKEKWQKTLKLGHVDSITIFSKCHHGLSYHPTKVGIIHPNLEIDLLKAQYEACKEINVNAPIYISAGLDTAILEVHPEWREMPPDENGHTTILDTLPTGFTKMCFNTPYLDYLCKQTEEVVEMYPNCDGIFFDIIAQGECLCPSCIKWMLENNLDPTKKESRQICAKQALEKYYIKTTVAAKSTNPDMPVFHNSGHISKGNLDVLKYFSHIELESLPTGGWGYDHFPMSAKYAQTTGFDFLGMSGKFHTTWGEFGGYKHPNALKYECMQMIAFGSKCSIGDQLHPNGDIDESTYKLIGEAYKEVEAKEKWCDNITSVADICVLSQEAEIGIRDEDTYICRVLLEGGFLFDLVDRTADFNKYKLVILADTIKVDNELKCKIDRFLANGGKLLLSGKSGLWKDKDEFAFNIGATYHGKSEYQPDYVVGLDSLELDFIKSPIVMYKMSQKIKVTDGTCLANIYEPYFNRTWEHFCSHQHAPYNEMSEYAGAVLNKDKNILYLAHPVFEIYGKMGAIIYKEYAIKAINTLLEEKTVVTNLPSMGRVSLMEQNEESRYVLHLLYANIINRGENAIMCEKGTETPGAGFVYPAKKIEVIEELMPIYDVKVELDLPKEIKSITIEPTGEEIPFEKVGNKITFIIPKFTCHIMPVLKY